MTGALRVKNFYQLYKRDIFYDFMFAFLGTMTWRWVYSKRKDFAFQESKCVPFSINTFPSFFFLPQLFLFQKAYPFSLFESERERERENQTDREKVRQKERDAEREIDRQTETQRERERERKMQAERENHIFKSNLPMKERGMHSSIWISNLTFR